MTAGAGRPPICLALLACLLLAGCTAPPIQMEIADAGGRKIVTLFHRGLFGLRSSETPCVREIVVSNFDAIRQAVPVWTATSPDDVQCAALASFEIGRTPAGFAETLNRLPTALRGRYRVEVSGIGNGAYDIVF